MYTVEYQLEDFNDIDREVMRNKDQVIDHLMFLLAKFEPIVLQVTYPDQEKYHYNQDGDEI